MSIKKALSPQACVSLKRFRRPALACRSGIWFWFRYEAMSDWSAGRAPVESSEGGLSLSADASADPGGDHNSPGMVRTPTQLCRTRTSPVRWMCRETVYGCCEDGRKKTVPQRNSRLVLILCTGCSVLWACPCLLFIVERMKK